MTKKFFTIAPGVPFTDALAEGLAQTHADPFRLADTRIFLPTRRACLHLRDAFLRRLNGEAALLPRMQPLADIDEEELLFADENIDVDIPPAIAPLRRKMLLAKLIRAKNENMPVDQAAQLAEALAQLLDQAQIMRCDFSNLASLVERQDLAQHWQETVKFLDILTGAWPKILADEGCIDPAERHNRVLEAQAAAWRAKPPEFPVIAAGSTGTMPATADFLDVISTLPQGAVILPGLDQGLDEEAWQAITETHPQYGMKSLLEKCGVKRAEVKVWPSSARANEARVRLLQESMRPAEVSEAWRHLSAKEIPPSALDGLTRVELDHPQEEAQAIALMLRAAEENKKTAAFVTPDRMLAERVAALLARWGIEANDSGGMPLAVCPVGGFLRDVLAAASLEAGPVDYLSLLKHPIAACGLSPPDCRARARELEIKLWRAQRPEKCAWLDEVKKLLHPLTAAWKHHRPLSEWIALHIQIAETVAASDTETGAARLWKGDDGEAAAEWLDDWRGAAHDFTPISGAEYAGLFATLAQTVTVRPRYAKHPRLQILGPLEARLIQADTVILGGLNEGVWPPEAAVDPWMSRPMKSKFGLRLPEERIGLSAHDFVQLASAPDVVLTRARRAGNAPTVPSRFLLQLETVLRALGYEDKPAPWQNWAQILDRPDAVTPCPAPAPCPPTASRPAKLSVTEIGTWQRNPYAIYAKHILKLRRLESLEAEIDAADRGIAIHQALDQFVKQFPSQLPFDALDQLITVGRKLFAAYDEAPQVRAFWWPRFERIAAWFIEHERERRAQGIKVLRAEAAGKMKFGAFTLSGCADRIDQLVNRHLAIIDYKTGSVATKDEVHRGLEPQLPLLALMAREGSFENLNAAPVEEIAYWRLTGHRDGAGEAKPVAGDVGQLADRARAGLENLIKKFADPATPYEAIPKPGHRPRYDDYGHLARLAEWGRTEEER